jgi:hypothetical protein
MGVRKMKLFIVNIEVNFETSIEIFSTIELARAYVETREDPDKEITFRIQQYTLDDPTELAL